MASAEHISNRGDGQSGERTSGQPRPRRPYKPPASTRPGASSTSTIGTGPGAGPAQVRLRTSFTSFPSPTAWTMSASVIRTPGRLAYWLSSTTSDVARTLHQICGRSQPRIRFHRLALAARRQQPRDAPSAAPDKPSNLARTAGKPSFDVGHRLNSRTSLNRAQAAMKQFLHRTLARDDQIMHDWMAAATVRPRMADTDGVALAPMEPRPLLNAGRRLHGDSDGFVNPDQGGRQPGGGRQHATFTW